MWLASNGSAQARSGDELGDLTAPLMTNWLELEVAEELVGSRCSTRNWLEYSATRHKRGSLELFNTLDPDTMMNYNKSNVENMRNLCKRTFALFAKKN